MANTSKMRPGTKARTKGATEAPAQGGDSLESVFSEIEGILKRHAPLFLFQDLGVRNKKSAHIIEPKPVAVPGAYGGKPVLRPLAAVILQKGYVGFYFMCIYGNDGVRKQLSLAFLKLLKGKSCFHIRKLDDGARHDIETALELGTKCYKERGWL